MKLVVQKIWQDIRKGENLDGYVGIVVALATSILSLIGIWNLNTIPSVTLAILALLASSTLVNRYKVEILQNKLENFETKSFSAVMDITKKFGTPAEILFEPTEASTGMFYKKLTEYIEDVQPGDEIVVMANFDIQREIINPNETDKHKNSREKYYKILANKAKEPNVTYRRIICFAEGPEKGKITADRVGPWLEKHAKDMLKLQKKKPGKIILKKSKVIFSPDILIIKGKLAVISLYLNDPKSGFAHTDGAMVFYNPPNEKVIEQLYDFVNIADNNSLPIKQIPE